MMVAFWARCGARVTEIDGRHVGTVVAVFGAGDSTTLKVRWDDTGWASMLEIDEVELEGSRTYLLEVR